MRRKFGKGRVWRHGRDINKVKNNKKKALEVLQPFFFRTIIHKEIQLILESKYTQKSPLSFEKKSLKKRIEFLAPVKFISREIIHLMETIVSSIEWDNANPPKLLKDELSDTISLIPSYFSRN